MSKDTSAPAFPVEADFHTFKPKDEAEWKRLLSGMTMRQYAAIKAMQGLLTDPNCPGAISTAVAAVAYADALLAELEK